MHPAVSTCWALWQIVLLVSTRGFSRSSFSQVFPDFFSISCSAISVSILFSWVQSSRAARSGAASKYEAAFRCRVHSLHLSTRGCFRNPIHHKTLAQREAMPSNCTPYKTNTTLVGHDRQTSRCSLGRQVREREGQMDLEPTSSYICIISEPTTNN